MSLSISRAVAYGDVELIKFLIAAKVKLDKGLYYWPIRYNRPDVIQLLVDAKLEVHATHILHALQNDHIEMLRIMRPMVDKQTLDAVWRILENAHLPKYTGMLTKAGLTR